MKKVLTFISIFALLFILVSCSSEDLKTVRENPEITTAVKQRYNIDFTKAENSIRLNSDKGTATSYYDVYLSSDYKDSVFVTELSLNDDLFKSQGITFKEAVETKRFKSLTVYPLMFSLRSSSLYSAEQTQVFKELTNSTYGITSYTGTTLNYDFGFTLNIPSAWTTTVKADLALEAYNDGNETLSFQVAYLPILYSRVNDSINCLNTYMFIPIYYCFTSGDKQISSSDNGYTLTDNPIKSFEKQSFVFEEDDEGNKTGYISTK